ncbi:stage III sporulation protein AG [Paramaledivibacter caminithermalis]|jgi:stage III sporulation protein AG|uniref:Stage III sporulation protein AG n=1 Tax=Paramaledivibacter caminithermalis (strain DSM 15212 / CIP 107654 / DViRD3) TaxID=1121301 RepID=A0A1M6JQW4_PARC5|nr:stage III sporulation protein AG [Paramaledivibacter caminithermalis]SHJ49077.1 stage III sporulation protein AG [Paramaledivibacter caminithermalis DSM 15212]
MKFLNKLKDILDNANRKKIINNLLVVVIICIIILISLSTFFPKEYSEIMDNDNIDEIDEASKDTKILETAYSDNMESRLEAILNQIEGVGEVEVMITYETTAEVVPASNTTKSEQTTQETDNQGGKRVTKQENITENIVTVSDKDYRNSPIVIKEIKPIIRGVIVVAQGADNPEIRNNLLEAVTTIFQIKSHKVKIYNQN